MLRTTLTSTLKGTRITPIVARGPSYKTMMVGSPSTNNKLSTIIGNLPASSSSSVFLHQGILKRNFSTQGEFDGKVSKLPFTIQIIVYGSRKEKCIFSFLITIFFLMTKMSIRRIGCFSFRNPQFTKNGTLGYGFIFILYLCKDSNFTGWIIFLMYLLIYSKNVPCYY